MIKREKFLSEYFGQVSIDDMFICWSNAQERSEFLDYTFSKFVTSVRKGIIIVDMEYEGEESK